MGDEEAREYILTTPEHNWRHHANRLSVRLHPNTLRWILFHLIETYPSTSASTWAIEKMYDESALFSYADIVQALSHPNRLVRSWAVMNLNSSDENTLLELLKPIRYDENPLVTHKVLTRIRGFALSDEEKIELMSPLFDLDRTRNVAIIHLGHLSLEPARKFEILSPFLISTNSDEVISAIRGLRDSGSEQTEQALVQCFDHENHSVLRCLLQSVASFGPWFEPHALHLTTISELYSDLLKAMKRSYGFNQVPIIEAIINGERNSIVVRGLALLSDIKSSESIEIVGSYLATHELRYIRRHAAEYMGEAGHLAGLPFLRQASNDISIGVRTSAKRSLEGILKARSVVL
jgi:HEAT repeat protein